MSRLVYGCLLSLLFMFPGASRVAADGEDYSCTNCNLQVGAGREHSCGLRDDGSISCWGSPTYGQTSPIIDPGRVYLQISAGDYHTCGIFDCLPGYVCTVGNLACWGRWVEGQTTPPINTPYSQVSAGKWHTCAVTPEGTIDCWGDDGSDQSTPLSESNWEYFEVAAGGQHTCAVFNCTPALGSPCPDGNVECWGRNNANQVDHPVNLVYSAITAGLFHSCGIRDTGTIDCWGSDTHDQSSPLGGTFSRVSAGGYHTCALRTDGTIACWGDDSAGQSSPPDGAFIDVAAGEFHSCAVKSDGLVFCWGEDANGRSWPTAGMCGLFRSDFETGYDCLWSNTSTLAWAADCDGDGYASPRSKLHCGSVMVSFPDECPLGSWTYQPATGLAFDCSDVNEEVFSGQTAFFSVGYGQDGGIGVRYDYNCDAVQERKLLTLSEESLCCSWSTKFDICEAVIQKGCGEPGWDGSQVAEPPECGEVADYRTCAGTQLTCGEKVEARVQQCR